MRFFPNECIGICQLSSYPETLLSWKHTREHGISSLVGPGLSNRTSNTRLTKPKLGKPLLTTERFPNDLDTTSLALMVTDCDDKVVNSVLDEMLGYVNEDGIIMV